MIAQNMVKAVGYARRSTDMQERSIPDQQAYVQRWAEENGYRIVRWYVDDAISGTSTKGREAFERMIHEAENGRDFDAVLVYDISRFSRGGSIEMGYYLHRLKLVGVEAVFCAEGIPEGDDGELLQGVKSWQARQYSVKLSRDSIRGHVSSVRTCKSSQGGFAPYGYDRRHQTSDSQVLRTLRWLPDGRKQEFGPDGKLLRVLASDETVKKAKSDIVRLVPGEPEKVRVVREIFEKYVDGLGYHSIAIELNQRAAPSPKGRGWCPQQVKMILQNPCYRGAVAWNRRTSGKINGVAGDGRCLPKKTPRRGWNGQNDWILAEDAHEPLVSRELFAQAQEVRRSRRGMGGLARPTNRFLLSGLIKCVHCGYNFHGRHQRHSGKVWRYYVDGGFNARGSSVCRYVGIPAQELDTWVLAKVRDIVMGDAEGTRAATDAFVKAVLGRRRKPDDLAGVEKELAAVNNRIKALVAMLADPNFGDMEELKQTLAELKGRRDGLEAHRQEAGRAREETWNEENLRRWARERFEKLGRAADGKETPQATREVVQAYVDRIEIDPKAKRGVLYLPADAVACLEAECSRRLNACSHAATIQ